MIDAVAISRAAVSAQRNLHEIAVMERFLHQRGELDATAAGGIRAYRTVELGRLDVCAEHYAALQPANDVVFQQTPEHA